MRGRTLLPLLAFVATALAAPWPCGAQGPAQPEASADEGDGAAPSAEQEEDPRLLFEQGRTAYEAGRLGEALTLFRRAYEISGRVELLYNVGLTADRLRRDEEAIAAYEAYLEQADDEQSRPAIEERIEILRRSLAEGEDVSERRDDDAPRPILVVRELVRERELVRDGGREDEAQGPGPLPWLVAGTGAAFLAGGVVLMLVAQHDIRRVEEAPAETRWATVESAHDRAPVLSTVGIVLAGIGLAGVGAGVLWAALTDEASGEAAVALGLDAGGVRLRGRF